MKVHAGVDAGTGYIHTITVTAANVLDIEETHNLIRKDDDVVYGDSGYLGIERHDEIRNDEHLRNVEFRINRRPSSIKISDSYVGINWDKQIENRKSSVRCKVEHAFLIVKQQFGYKKTAYKGIAKNMNRLIFCLPVRTWPCVPAQDGLLSSAWDNYANFSEKGKMNKHFSPCSKGFN